MYWFIYNINEEETPLNDNLEAMAKQLYDYWFVQFDFPNEEGKPYKSCGGAMVWNDKLKREIPQGWDFCFLEDLLTIRNGRDHKHLADGIYPVYGSGGEMRKVSEYLYDGESVLMPRKGSLNNIMYVNEAFWTVDTMFYSEMKLSNCAKYIYYTIKDIDFTRWNSGTGVPSMTSSTLYSIKLVKPQNETLKKFDEMISPLFEHMKQISEQNVVLTKQRDELLPLLMNGQASVNYHLTDNWVFECKIITIGCILDIWIFFLRLYQCNPMALPTQADACGSGAIEWFWQLVHRGWSPLPTYRISCDAGSDDLYGK